MKYTFRFTVFGLILLQTFVSKIEQYYACQCQFDLSWYVLREQRSVDKNLNSEQSHASATFS